MPGEDGCKREPLIGNGCEPWDVACNAQFAIDSAMRDMATQITEAVRKALASVGSMWLNTPRIDVMAEGGEPVAAGVHAGEHAPLIDGVNPINEVLGWVMWIALGICVLSLIVAGVRMSWHARSGEAQAHGDRLGVILLATMIVSGGVGLVAGVMRPGDSMGTTAVAFIQNSTWWYTVAFGVVGVLVGGMRMAWDQRADPGKDLLRSLMTLLVVSGIGLSVISALQVAGDEFSKWIIGKSLECETVDGECLADKMIGMLLVEGVAELGEIITIIFAVIALLVTLIQIALLVVRNGLLIILAGVLPLASAATNTSSGKQMFSRVTGWIIGFLLYKPVAAIIYAAAFKLASGNSEDVILSIVTGMTLMVMSLLALPAMMTLITPAVGNVTGGGGGAAGVAAAALPTGAMMLSKGGSSGGGSRGGGRGPAGAAAAGAAGKGPSGSGDSSSWAPPNAADRRPGGGPSGAGGSGGGAPGSGGGSAGSGGAGESSSGSSSGGSSGSPSGAASGGGQGGGSPAGGGAAGSSSGGKGDPSGAESSSGGNNHSAAAAMMVAGALQGVVDDATGAGEGPDGSVEQ